MTWPGDLDGSPGDRRRHTRLTEGPRELILRGALPPVAQLYCTSYRAVCLVRVEQRGTGSTGHRSRLTGARSPGSIARVIDQELPGSDDRADWAVIRKADGRHLGEVVLNHLEPENGCMGFRIALFGEGILGRGFGTQATKAVLAYGFDVVGLHRIELGVYAFNPRARRAYEKAGFRREGVRRDALCWEGEWHDEILMAVLASEWAS